jgi:hypothetical protein
MKTTKVTNLEKFTLHQIFRPYQTMLGIGDKTLNKLTKEYNVDTARELLIKNKEWAKLVLSRISRCHFRFPDYINHPLVKFIKNAQTINWE